MGSPCRAKASAPPERKTARTRIGPKTVTLPFTTGGVRVGAPCAFSSKCQ